MPSFDTDDFLTDIHHVTDRLGAAGLSRVIVVDLTRPEIGVPVVRVVVPGLEIYAVDQDRIGRRCRDARNRRLPRSQL
jgi:ribosomal protein S12 methylthiotransferase accessory factor